MFLFTILIEQNRKENFAMTVKAVPSKERWGYD